MPPATPTHPPTATPAIAPKREGEGVPRRETEEEELLENPTPWTGQDRESQPSKDSNLGDPYMPFSRLEVGVEVKL